MTPDQINEVKVTNRGFVYKGNVIVAITGLDTLLEEKVVETPQVIAPKATVNSTTVLTPKPEVTLDYVKVEPETKPEVKRTVRKKK